MPRPISLKGTPNKIPAMWPPVRGSQFSKRRQCMSLSDVIKTALDQMQYIAKTETVVGKPIMPETLR